MASSHRAVGLVHRTAIASSARLVLARATRPPNWIISGSFWNCGAPPDIEIAAAMLVDARTLAASMATKVAIHAAGPITSPAGTSARKIAIAIAPVNAKLARLKMILRACSRDCRNSATPEPVNRAAMNPTGSRRYRPRTAGTSLSENAWVSRRKWTWTSISSARAKKTATTGQGISTGRGIGGRPRSSQTKPIAARPASRIEKAHTRTIGRGNGRRPSRSVIRRAVRATRILSRVRGANS